MHRDLKDGEPLANLLTTNALAAAGDTLLRFKGGEYEFRGVAGASLVTGTNEAITRVQRTSSHYAQRPDRTYSPLDPTLTSLGGWSLQSNFERTSGRHWLWGVNTKVDSENFETNDVANLNGADGVILGSNIRYRETRPGRIFRAYTIGFNQSNDSTLRFLRQSGSLRPSVNVTWANFWTSSWSVTRNLPTQSVSLTRGGPVMAGPANWSTSFSVGNQSSAQTRWSGSATLTEDEEGGSITARERQLLVQAGTALAAVGQPVVRAAHRHATVRHDPARRTPRGLQHALHLRGHRPQHAWPPSSG